MKKITRRFLSYGYIGTALVFLVVITGVSHLFGTYLDLINIALIHLVPVVIVSMHGEFRSTIFITVLSVIFFNFLYIPPLYSFSVHNELYLWSFFIFGVVGWIITVQAKNLDIQKRQNTLRESLLNIVSHDLRTPLATIHGSVNLILTHERLDKEKVHMLLEDIDYASLRMKRLITNLFETSRLTDKNSDLQYEWCDFEDIIGVALEEFSQTQTDELLHIEVEGSELFWGDNMMLTQLFVNLFDNAFKYAVSKTHIDFKIKQTKNEVHISISNKTDHLDKKRVKNIFDKFYRLEYSDDIFGSGIGLAICKSIVTLHEGTIGAHMLGSRLEIDIQMPVRRKVDVL